MSSENTIEMGVESTFTNELIGQVAADFTKLYKPSLEKTRDQLIELNEKQVVLTEQLHDENLKLSWSQSSVEMIKMFDTINIYQNKLVAIKKEMKLVHDKNIKLKKKVLKLQQYKEKMEYMQNQQREMELKREQDLIGKTCSE